MKEKVKEIINNIFSLLNSEESIQKKDLHSNLLELNNILEEILKDFVPNENRFANLFRYNEDDRLAQIEHKIENFKLKPELSLLEGIQFCENKLNEFLDVYHIGFKKSFELNSSGFFEVEIGSLITRKNSFHDNEVSEEIHFDLQMDNLRFVGIDIDYEKGKKGDVNILATENSINNLRKILTEFGARLLEFTFRAGVDDILVLHKIKFKIKPNDLLKGNYNMPKITFNCDKNIVNPDEKFSIIHDLKELWSAYLTYIEVEQCKDSCGSLIKSLFASVCNKVEFNCSITNSENEKYQKIREKNLLIRKKEKELGSLINGDFIKDTTKTIYQKLNKIGYETVNFRCRDLKITQYSIQADFIFSTGFCFEKEIKELSEEEIRKIFDCNDGNLDEESLKVLATEKNMETLSSIIGINIPSSLIVNYNIENHWSIRQNYIKGFTISLDNLNGLF